MLGDTKHVTKLDVRVFKVCIMFIPSKTFGYL